MESYIDGAYRTFFETVPGALDNKEGYIVALGAAGAGSSPSVPTVQLWTGADSSPAIGVVFGKLKLGDPEVTIRLFGKGGTLKLVAGGAIAYGARVMPQNGGQAVTSSGANIRTVGIKLTPGNSAAGDMIEVMDLVESNGTFAN